MTDPTDRLIARGVRPIDEFHDEMMAKAEADHQKRLAAQPPADQTVLRDRTAEAALAAVETALGDTLLPAARAAALSGIAAVLPATADRAAVLREAADALDNSERLRDLTDDHMLDINAAANELRRMAAETPAAQTEAHEPLSQWRVEILDGDEWMPASGLRRDRSQVAEQLRMASERRPLWNDGTQVQRRLVRETTTYTVEQAAAGARQDGAQQ